MKLSHIVLSGFIFLTQFAWADSRNIYWVSVAKAELHAEASANSDIKAYWALNTPVVKKEEQGDWCAVADNNETTSGFILCNQLISDKQMEMNVFWNHPSVDHLLSVARYLEQSLTDEQRQAEYEMAAQAYSHWSEQEHGEFDEFEIPLKRPANEEFDAMKAMLLKGVKVNRDLSLYDGYFQKLDEFKAKELYEVGDYLDELLRKSILPSIKPSLFLSAQEMLFASATPSVDDLSVVANSKLSAKVTKSAYATMGRDEPYNVSYWDIGEMEMTLENPVAVYSVAKNGLVGKQTGKLFGRGTGEGGCDYEMPIYLPSDMVSVDNYPAIEYPLVQFFTQKNISPKVHIRTQSYRLEGLSSEQKSINVHVNAIDLNADNIADMAITEAAIPAYDGGTKSWVTYFVNLNGVWYFAFNFVTPECT